MDPITFLVVAVVCLAIGYVAGTLINTSRADRNNPDAEKIEGLKPPVAGHTEVMRVLRDRPDDPVLVMMDGKMFSSVSDLNTDQHTRLEKLILDLRTWLGFSPAVLKEPLTPPAEIPVVDAISSSKPASPAIVGIPAAAPLPPAVPPFTTAPKSIVAQIDDILQERISNTPMGSRKIRLVENPNAGVVVMIGLQQYPGIDDVPDPEVRNVIRQAVSEWEQIAK